MAQKTSSAPAQDVGLYTVNVDLQVGGQGWRENFHEVVDGKANRALAKSHIDGLVELVLFGAEPMHG